MATCSWQPRTKKCPQWYDPSCVRRHRAAHMAKGAASLDPGRRHRRPPVGTSRAPQLGGGRRTAARLTSESQMTPDVADALTQASTTGDTGVAVALTLPIHSGQKSADLRTKLQRWILGDKFLEVCKLIQSHWTKEPAYFLESIQNKNCRFVSKSCGGGYAALRMGKCKPGGPPGLMAYYSYMAPGTGVQNVTTNAHRDYCKPQS